MRFSQTCEFWSSKANWRSRFSLPSIILTDLLGNKTVLHLNGFKTVICDWWISIRFVSFLFQGSLLVIVIMIDGSEKRNCEGSLRSCPLLPIIPSCFSREEGMIHFFVGSHVKKPESGLFSDWIGNNTDDLRCSNWPKCRHPLVVVDFSQHFCLRNEQWIHTRVRYKISAGTVFSNLKNA